MSQRVCKHCGHDRGEHLQPPAMSSMPASCMGDDGACDCTHFEPGTEEPVVMERGLDFWM
jgi:hypothetical protein